MKAKNAQNMKSISAVVALVISQCCYASGWTPPLALTGVFTENSDTIVANTSEGLVYTSGCYANLWTIKGDTDARRGREYATLLTAMAAGKKVKFWFEDVCGSWNYHSASSVMIVEP